MNPNQKNKLIPRVEQTAQQSTHSSQKADNFDKETIEKIIDSLVKGISIYTLNTRAPYYSRKAIKVAINSIPDNYLNLKIEKQKEFDNFEIATRRRQQQRNINKKQKAKILREQTDFQTRAIRVRDYLISHKYTISTLISNKNYSLLELEKGIELINDEKIKSEFQKQLIKFTQNKKRNSLEWKKKQRAKKREEVLQGINSQLQQVETEQGASCLSQSLTSLDNQQQKSEDENSSEFDFDSLEEQLQQVETEQGASCLSQSLTSLDNQQQKSEDENSSEFDFDSLEEQIQQVETEQGRVSTSSGINRLPSFNQTFNQFGNTQTPQQTDYQHSGPIQHDPLLLFSSRDEKKSAGRDNALGAPRTRKGIDQQVWNDCLEGAGPSQNYSQNDEPAPIQPVQQLSDTNVEHLQGPNMQQ